MRIRRWLRSLRGFFLFMRRVLSILRLCFMRRIHIVHKEK